MSGLYYLVIFIIFSSSATAFSPISLDNLVMEFPNHIEIHQCSYNQAYNCFLKGNNKANCTELLERKFGAHRGSYFLEMGNKLLDTGCVTTDRLKKLTTHVPAIMALKDIGTLEEQEIFSMEMDKFTEIDKDYSLLIRSCKILAIRSCFANKHHCFMKSHYKAIIEIFDVCYFESDNHGKKKPALNQNFDDKVFPNSVILPQSTTWKTPIYTTLATFSSSLNQEHELLKSIGHLTLDQLKNINKYAQIDFAFKKLICEK